MSKERLEEIKNTQYQIIEVSKTDMQEDFNYLLSYINNLEMAFDDLDSDYIDLTEQNKRYREAREIIEQVCKESYVRSAYGYEDGFLDGLDTAINIIDEALEENKWND